MARQTTANQVTYHFVESGDQWIDESGDQRAAIAGA